MRPAHELAHEALAPRLNDLFRFYTQQITHPPGLCDRYTVFKSVLEGIGGSAGIYYWFSADGYAHDKAPWLRYSLDAGNGVGGVAFLVNATDLFLNDRLNAWHIPPELSSVLKTESKKDLLRLDAKILFFSTICAVPFAIVAYSFPLPICKTTPCREILAVHSGIANTILHAIPWALFFTPDYWIYRLPFLPIETCYEKYQFYRLSPIQKRQHKLTEAIASVHQKYRGLITDFYRDAMHCIMAHAVKVRRDGLPENLLSQMESLEGIGERLREWNLVPQNPTAGEQSKWYRHCLKIDKFLLDYHVIAVIGAIFMNLGLIGWTVETIYLGLNMGMRLWQANLFGLLPAYSLIMLTAFFGQFFLKRVYQFCTTILSIFVTGFNRALDQLPMEAKFYPKLFISCMLVNAYLGFFSYATAELLIDQIFLNAMWDPIRIHLKNIAYPALQILCGIAFYDFFITYTRKFTALFGTGNLKVLAGLRIQADNILARFPQIEGEVLLNSLEKCAPNLLSQIKITHEALVSDIASVRESKQEIEALAAQLVEERATEFSRPSWGAWICGFFYRKKSAERQPLVHVTGSAHPVYYDAAGFSSPRAVVGIQ